MNQRDKLKQQVNQAGQEVKRAKEALAHARANFGAAIRTLALDIPAKHRLSVVGRGSWDAAMQGKLTPRKSGQMIRAALEAEEGEDLI